ncbi:MCP four helix bundle domain-containing protein [Chitinophaga alhagiae]|uniref:MCP four helix bundle domain-containing protein n=1 Tax=Chitinophaga alhagiae TaxID=2203219 RepID=UPI000E5BF5CE|nr:MCP four helix bundle domain-containing protein [Chitinophaga alhagiae]
MKRFFQIKTKFKVCCLFIVIIVLVLLNNLRERRSINRLDHSISSIYQDRLLPATYLYGIANHLYEQRLMGNDGHSEAIDSLVTIYETTYLTPDEKKQWASFKSHLATYRQQAATGDTLAMLQQFQETVTTLNALSSIQIGEGKNLQTDSKNIVSGSTLSSRLELTLLIILGVLAIVLLGLSDKAFNPAEHQSLN